MYYTTHTSTREYKKKQTKKKQKKKKKKKRDTPLYTFDQKKKITLLFLIP